MIKATKKSPRSFILCPHCQAKSKKLCSEFGGLQTRQCQKGHVFEVDTFMGMNRYVR
jgi:hypothetical protein